MAMDMELVEPTPPTAPAGGGVYGASPPGNLRRGFRRNGESVAPELPEIAEESGDIVHVAVGRSEQKVVSLLRWTFRRFGNKGICLVHVHQPSPLIPTLLGKLPASQANGEVLSAYRREEKEQMEKLLSNYVNICSRAKVKASYVVIEADQVDKGLVDLVNRYRIRKLVMGAVPGKSKKINKKANYATNHAPPYCEIWFINKEKHVWTREASAELNSPQHVFQIQSLPAATLESLQDYRSECLSPSQFPQSSSYCEARHSVQEIEIQAGKGLGPTLTSATSGHRPHNIYPSPSISSTGSGYPSFSERRVSTDSNSNSTVLTTKLDESFHSQLENEKFEADSENEVNVEQLNCYILESKAMDAIDKAKAFESAHALEVKLRNDAEDALRATIQEQEKLLEEREYVTRELQKKMRSIALLDRHAEEAKRRCEEAAGELKFVQTSIEALRRERRKIRQQKMEAAHWLDQWRTRGDDGAVNCNRVSGIADDPIQLAIFSLSDLENATCNFSESFKIGQGGYGCVFKGEMLDKTVAIKKLFPHSVQGQSEFQQEVQVLGKLQHPHLVTLIGVCPEAWSLVYEYLPNGSLQNHLFRKGSTSSCLTWRVRARIIAEISSALFFLHSSKPNKIVHGNLKLENILLNLELSCKICDFGICRLIPEENLRCPSFRRYTEPKSAFPYTDPEFHRTGILTPKSDVYAFGLIILQLLTQRPPMGLTSEVRKAVSCGRLESVLDTTAGEWPVTVARRLVDLGLQCCELNSRDRPDLRPTLVTELERLHVSEERPVPSYFLCPILQEIMHDPQIAADGFTYEGEALRGWLESGRETSPMTNLTLSHLHLTPNHALRLAIQEWLCKS